MTTEELIEVHKQKALEIMRDKTSSTADKPGERADQLVEATRHLLCCFILKEATEEQLMALSMPPYEDK